VGVGGIKPMIFGASWRNLLKTAIIAAIPLEMATLLMFDALTSTFPLHGTWRMSFLALLGVLAGEAIHYPALKLLQSAGYHFSQGVLYQMILFAGGYVEFVLLCFFFFPLYRAVKWCFSMRYFGSE
jgi:hypothetical protein